MVDESDKHIKMKAVRKETLGSIVRRVYERFIRIRGEPREIALGFALGIFVGMTPTVGVQTLGVAVSPEGGGDTTLP